MVSLKVRSPLYIVSDYLIYLTQLFNPTDVTIYKVLSEVLDVDEPEYIEAFALIKVAVIQPVS